MPSRYSSLPRMQGMSVQGLDERLDRLEAAFRDLWPGPVIDPEDAARAALRLRQLNKRIWSHVRLLDSIASVDPSEVIAEAATVGMGPLLEAGVLRINSEAWAKWRTG